VNIRHYYHVYADGEWAKPVTEHLDALAASGMLGSLIVGLVGDRVNRAFARDIIEWQLDAAAQPQPVRWADADAGWEQFTLHEMWRDARIAAEPFAALYCHTKGAANPAPSQDRWRQAMTTALVGGWQKCTELLAGHDSVGCHRYVPPPPRDNPFYAGNFWWARSPVLAGLPDPMSDDVIHNHGDERWTSHRYAAEIWLQPWERWADVLPGTVSY
jgi:hypothetical protein